MRLVCMKNACLKRIGVFICFGIYSCVGKLYPEHWLTFSILWGIIVLIYRKSKRYCYGKRKVIKRSKK